MTKNISFILLFVLFVFSLDVQASASSNSSFFQGLWDFIDAVYDVVKDITNYIYAFFLQMPQMIFFWWLKFKINTVIFIWGIAEPIIDSLNLTDVINQASSALRPDWQAFIAQVRLAEGINILLSAKVTKLILNMIGW